jgi:hypothetical protein
MVAVVALVATTTSSAVALGPLPFCGRFETNGGGAYYRFKGVVPDYDYWYGWRKWCESPSRVGM